MLVRDIYGGDYSLQGLSGDVIASSFGKAMGCNQAQSGRKIYFKVLKYLKKYLQIIAFAADDKKFSEADIARSLLYLISNDIGQIASLYASLHNMNKIYFGGYFLHNHPLSMYTISYAIKFWTQVSIITFFRIGIFVNYGIPLRAK